MHHHRQGIDEDFIAKPQFAISVFLGGMDVEDYQTWELKIDKLFQVNNYSNEKKLLLASNGLDDYATYWFEQFIHKRMEHHELPIITWEQMKQHLHTRFVPCHYKHSLFEKLTRLQQDLKSIGEYHKEMET